MRVTEVPVVVVAVASPAAASNRDYPETQQEASPVPALSAIHAAEVRDVVDPTDSQPRSNSLHAIARGVSPQNL
ncbi:hypothetical protein HK100_006415, partial [Physocladia obscura]